MESQKERDEGEWVKQGERQREKWARGRRVKQKERERSFTSVLNSVQSEKSK